MKRIKFTKGKNQCTQNILNVTEDKGTPCQLFDSFFFLSYHFDELCFRKNHNLNWILRKEEKIPVSSVLLGLPWLHWNRKCEWSDDDSHLFWQVTAWWHTHKNKDSSTGLTFFYMRLKRNKTSLTNRHRTKHYCTFFFFYTTSILYVNLHWMNEFVLHSLFTRFATGIKIAEN